MFRIRSFRRRTVVAASLVLGMLAGQIPAQASVWTGACPVQVDFSFGSKVRSAATLSRPSYSVSISNALGLPCAVSLEVSQPLRTTSGGGNGTSLVWTCESTYASGSWSQQWSPSLPPVSGSHVITGTWGDWTLIATSSSLNYAGVAALTVHPLQAAKLLQCETGGITSLSMLGTMVFQDPEIPSG